jgi:UDP-N-acetylmuramate: L-alanyl-gamma-D-glutamyl-meso-diaminopimelate ligase
MRIHFIAIGGAVMHNLAIALHKKGYEVTGSDDEIFEPSRNRLAAYGLLPEGTGWDPSRISVDLDAIILGMHAKADNPELIKARDVGIKIWSFPEYLYEQTKTKKRIVVAGSHGKTTTTAMIMHALKYNEVDFDYMVGSLIEGYETMVGLSDNTGVAVFEGDEYLTSPIDRRPKFHLYRPVISVITGIAWDHINVFPTFENYVDQFRIFVDTILPGGTLIYNEDDKEVKMLAAEARADILKIPYRTHGYFQNRKGFYAATHSRTIPLHIFGEHNMQNLSAAREASLSAGISEEQFYQAITSFEGTSKRLQKLGESDNSVVFLDFAHAPSKVKATLDAVAERYTGKRIVACLELHTYSSLNTGFLPNYQGTLGNATAAYIYFNPHAVEIKKLEPVSKEDIARHFGGDNLKVFDNSDKLFDELKHNRSSNQVFLLMSSGDFNGTDMQKLAKELLE